MPKPKPKPKSVQFASHTRLFEQPLAAVLDTSARVDREAGVIRGVKILGRDSDNGRQYSDQAMTDAVVLYEGCKVNIDHDDAPVRAAEQTFGELRNCRIQEVDGQKAVFGDLHYIRSHPLAEFVAEAAERFPQQLGLSHDAFGPVVQVNGVPTVTGIEHVYSVDIVSTAATNTGLFEARPTRRQPDQSGRRNQAMSKSMKRIATILREQAPKVALAKRLREQAPDDLPLEEMEVEVADESAPEEQLKTALKAMINAVLDDDSLDAAGAVAKIKEILKVRDNLNEADSSDEEEKLEEGDGEKEEIEEGSDGKEKVEEGRRKKLNALAVEVASLRAAQVRLTAERDATIKLAEAGVKPSAAKIAAFVSVKTEEGRQELLESWKPAEGNGKGKPAFSKPAHDSGDSDSYEKLKEAAGGRFVVS